MGRVSVKKWSQTSARTSMRFSPTQGHNMGGEKERKELVITCKRSQQTTLDQMEHGWEGGGGKLITYIWSEGGYYSKHKIGWEDSTENMQICLLSLNPVKEAEFWKSCNNCPHQEDGYNIFRHSAAYLYLINKLYYLILQAQRGQVSGPKSHSLEGKARIPEPWKLGNTLN